MGRVHYSRVPDMAYCLFRGGLSDGVNGTIKHLQLYVKNSRNG